MAPIRIPSGTYNASSSTTTAHAGASTASPSSGWDYILKFILIGDSCVGKSSLLVRLTDDRFLIDPDPTIGVEFGSHLIQLDNGETVKVQVWDTAGSESFRSITRSYYRGAAGALLVYDVTHRPSFLNVKTWLDDVRSNAEDKVCVVLVGNMFDLVENDEVRAEEQGQAQAETTSTKRERTDRRRSRGKTRRQVSYNEAKQFAQQEGLLFLEASAKTGHNVQEAFAQAVSDIHSKFSSPASAAKRTDDGKKGSGGSKYDNATLGKRSRMRARAGGRTSGTITLDAGGGGGGGGGGRNVSGFSIRSLTGGGGGQQAQSERDADGTSSGTGECCVIC
ncbi:related to YPT31 - GTP-binding protein of the rab family [Melanopsichium pennsylvanicum]|uniref:Related to YPT31 - GTP-binding protein of the rab family n=1 Tax=Melanopsichium pennsylvanicum TaxID=63383 RepID=A0AAJ4XLV9_9BASI|nr:related to YPT31 - GTP-binding protein of the rab family [Melanopsichium pennsylvanicum]